MEVKTIRITAERISALGVRVIEEKPSKCIQFTPAEITDDWVTIEVDGQILVNVNVRALMK